MNIILLSGGSGRRLWPLSNDTRSKQFLKLLKNDRGDFESMVQRVYGQIKKAGIKADITIATGASQVDSIKNQLGDMVDIVIEPERRDTFPAIALACTYLAYEKNLDDDEVILVLPVDPYADMEYFNTLVQMEEAVLQDVADLVLMGIKPNSPSTKYGYIVPAKETISLQNNMNEKYISEKTTIQKVERFTEKPSEEAANLLISHGAVWNGGVFAFRLRYLMNIIKSHRISVELKHLSYKEIQKNYKLLNKISFDYEVVERASSVAMVLYDGYWKDMGTWNMLSEEMKENYIGRVTIGEETRNTTVINELSIPIIALGVKDLVIAASPDGILITDKIKSTSLKAYVDQISERPMYGEGIWGEYRAYDYHQYSDSIKSLTKHLTIKAGQSIAYQAHRIREEICTIVSGCGEIVIDGAIKRVGRGDVISIARGQKHAMKAHGPGDLHYIEVQIGMELEEGDCEGYEWEW
ncbi:MAG: mannose-phosphate guanylyltransferase [Herbinix sp.]|jgi:mannose-1-phosphate guanylyltransferase|nr:mannose-phosphate guanylyltransferase [Herbinix sp.]